MRRRLCRQHQGPKIARHHPPRVADPGQSRSSRRGRRRPAGRRRRRLHDPDARTRCCATGPRSAASCCRRPAATRSRCASCRWRRRRGPSRSRTCERFIRVEGQGLLGLARGAGRHRPGSARRSSRRCRTSPRRSSAPGPDIADQDAFERKILTIRKQALNSVSIAGRAARAAGAARFLHPVLLDPHRGLQGPAAGAAGRQLLRGSAQPADRVGAGAGASALLDQHLPVVAAGASVPLSLPQRRDQHGARQRQLDARRAARRCRRSCWAPISARWCR